MSRTQIENIFAQSTFSNTIWSKVTIVMEDGSLKDQKLTKKHLIFAPEVKHHHLQPLCWLPESVQGNLLDVVLDEELSLNKMKEKANKYRQLELIKFDAPIQDHGSMLNLPILAL